MVLDDRNLKLKYYIRFISQIMLKIVQVHLLHDVNDVIGHVKGLPRVKQ